MKSAQLRLAGRVASGLGVLSPHQRRHPRDRRHARRHDLAERAVAGVARHASAGRSGPSRRGRAVLRRDRPGAHRDRDRACRAAHRPCRQHVVPPRPARCTARRPTHRIGRATCCSTRWRRRRVAAGRFPRLRRLQRAPARRASRRSSRGWRRCRCGCRYPPALHQGSIYENQTAATRSYFARPAERWRRLRRRRRVREGIVAAHSMRPDRNGVHRRAAPVRSDGAARLDGKLVCSSP